jgi:hypothetical protein
MWRRAEFVSRALRSGLAIVTRCVGLYTRIPLRHVLGRDRASLTRSSRLILALFIACTVPLWSGIHGVRASSSTPVLRRFILPVRMDGPPAIAGNTVAWVTRPGTCHVRGAPWSCPLPSYLHLADVRSFHPRTIVRLAATVSNVSLQLSQQYLVWMATRYPALGWWLWSRNLRTGRQTLVDSSPVEGGPAAAGYPGLSLRGDTLAMIRHQCTHDCTRPGPSFVVIVNLGTGEKHVVAVSHATCRILSGPTLSLHTLTWTDSSTVDQYGCGGDSRVEVMRLDPATGAVRHLAIRPPRGMMAYDVTGNDRYLAWTQATPHTNSGSRVLLLDTLTGRSVHVTGPGADRPIMDGNLLVWYGQYSATIGALDLRTWRYYVLARTHDAAGISTGPDFLGRPWTTRVAWDEFRFRDTGGESQNSLVTADVP